MNADSQSHRPSSEAARALLLGLCLSLGVRSPAAAQAPRPTFPITIQQAVRHAVETYPTVRASDARTAASEAGVDLSGAAYVPRLDAAYQLNKATRNNVAGLLLPGTMVPTITGPVADTTSASIWGSAAALLLSWEAFDFGQRGASTAVARSQLSRATAAAELTRLEVGVRTADAFLLLAAAQETVRAVRANVERQQVFAGAVAALVKNELRPGADESRAQADLAAARIQLAQAEQGERVARAYLAQWLGVSPGDVQISHGPLLAEAPPSAPVGGDAMHHPRAETQMAAVESSQAAQEVFSKSYYPRVNLQTAFSVRGTGAAPSGVNLGGTHGLRLDTPNWAVGLTLTFPVFDYFSLRDRTRVEAANERAERAAYDGVVRELSTQAEEARAQRDGAREVARNTPVQLQAARALEQQSRARYDAGLATIIEVADAQRLLLQAEVADAVARLGVWRAFLAEAAAGGDLSPLMK